MTWQDDGIRYQAKGILEWRKQIRKEGDYYYNLYKNFTNDVDYDPRDHGEPYKGDVQS